MTRAMGTKVFDVLSMHAQTNARHSSMEGQSLPQLSKSLIHTCDGSEE